MYKFKNLVMLSFRITIKKLTTTTRNFKKIKLNSLPSFPFQTSTVGMSISIRPFTQQEHPHSNIMFLFYLKLELSRGLWASGLLIITLTIFTSTIILGLDNRDLTIRQTDHTVH